MDSIKRIEIYPVLLISFLYFLVTYYISFLLYQNNLFIQVNHFFDADPPTNLSSLAHGFNEGRNAYSHAFLEILSLPVFAIQSILSTLYNDIDTRRIREILALSYSPLFGALSIIYFYKLLKTIKIQQSLSYLLVLIYMFSFSTLIFSTLVDTYIISGALITILLYFYAKSDLNKNIDYKKWLFLGATLAGITITNISIFFIVFFSYKIRRGISYYLAFRDTLIMCLLILLVVILYYKITQIIIGANGFGGYEGSVGWIRMYFATSPNEIFFKSANMISAFYNSFFGIFITLNVTDNCLGPSCHNLSFLRGQNTYPIIVLLLSIFLLYLFKSYQFFSKSGLMWLFSPLALIIGYNFIFHSFFGKEMFLYSQHWFVASALLFLIPLMKNRIFLLLILLAEIYLASCYILYVHEVYELTLPILTLN
ncbi:hypothetical protein LCGC14_2522870, partial [marine sediment metagenome]